MQRAVIANILFIQFFLWGQRWRLSPWCPAWEVLGRLVCRVTYHSHTNFLLLIVASKGSCEPTMDVILLRTYP